MQVWGTGAAASKGWPKTIMHAPPPRKNRCKIATVMSAAEEGTCAANYIKRASTSLRGPWTFPRVVMIAMRLNERTAINPGRGELGAEYSKWWLGLSCAKGLWHSGVLFVLGNDRTASVENWLWELEWKPGASPARTMLKTIIFMQWICFLLIKTSLLSKDTPCHPGLIVTEVERAPSKTTCVRNCT